MPTLPGHDVKQPTVKVKPIQAQSSAFPLLKLVKRKLTLWQI